MNYVDGFVAAVPTANREAYRKHAQDMSGVFKNGKRMIYGGFQMIVQA
jgi:uncharacterized protein YbaA (DUF1428 family)